MIQAKQIVTSFDHNFLFLSEARQAACNPSSLTTVTHNAFNNIRVITIHKYRMRKDAKMKLHVPVCSGHVLDRVSFWDSPP